MSQTSIGTIGLPSKILIEPNLRMHLTRYSVLRPPTPAYDAYRWAS